MKKIILFLVMINCLLCITGCNNENNNTNSNKIQTSIENHTFYYNLSWYTNIKASITFKNNNTGVFSEKKWVLEEENAKEKIEDFVYNINDDEITIELKDEKLSFYYDKDTNCIYTNSSYFNEDNNYHLFEDKNQTNFQFCN